MARPQDPTPPFPYLTEDVRLVNERAGVTLAGTLTLPNRAEVPPSSNIPRLLGALAIADNNRVTVEEFPGLNHLFQTATTWALSEYEEIEETMAPAVLDRISRWIAALLPESSARRLGRPLSHDR
jgi:hypothetical protein